MKVQIDQSCYSTVGKISCLVHVQWTKAQSHQSRIVLFLFDFNVLYMFSSECMCMCVWERGGGGGYLAL